LRHFIAFIFRVIFRLDLFKKTYYGFYKRIFKPLNLFKGVRKKILYRNKFLLLLEIEDWIQQNLYFLNEYEEREIRFVERYLKPGDVFIDVGAHIGLFSLVASGKIGQEGTVYSFEPTKKNLNSLQNHIEINQLRNIITEPLAISDKEQELNLFLDESKMNSGAATSYTDSFTKKETVFSVSLDHYFSNKKVPAVKLIKIDIEGGEYLALLGMRNILKKDKPALLIEINPQAHYGQDNLETFLSGLGYKKYYISEDNSLAEERSVYDKSHNYLFSCLSV
jgi:FkbM family methyltransferase